MTDGIRYVVELDLRQVGNLALDRQSQQADRLQRSVDSAKFGFQDMRASADRLGSSLDWVAQKAAGVAKWTAIVGGTAVFAGLTYGVAGLNAELERAQMSLGTIFSAQGIARDVPTGITMAADQVQKMRLDAQRLPGEFQDLFNIFLTGAVPVFRSGASPEQWRTLASKAMVAAAVSSLPMDQAAREFAMLVEGRSGAHNVFGMRLLGLSGDSAEKFNKMTNEQRLELLSKELEKYAGALDVFGNSWEGASSTFVDNLKNTGRMVTEPLFHNVVDALAEANRWFDTNREDIGEWADTIGNALGDAFNTGKYVFMEYAPLVKDFAETAWSRLTAVWQDIQPAAQTFAQTMKDALADPNGTIDKLTDLAKLLIALRLGSMATGMLANMAGMLPSAKPTYGGTLKEGKDGAIIVTKGGASPGGMSGEALSRRNAAVGLGLGIASTAIAFGAIGDNDHPEAQMAASMGGGALAGAQMGGIWGALAGAILGGIPPLVQAHSQYADTVRSLEQERAAAGDQIAYGTRRLMLDMELGWDEVGNSLYGKAEEFSAAGDAVAASLYQAAADIASATWGINHFADAVTKSISDKAGMDYSLAMVQAARDMYSLDPSGKREKAPKHKGGGGMNIQKVEIVVTSNQDPSRIARLVVDELGKMKRAPNASRWTPNYSMLERT